MRRGARPADGEGRRRRGHRGRAELLRRRSSPGRGQGVRKGVRAGAEDVQPAPRADAHEAHQSEEGARRGSRFRADLLGRGARSRRRQAQRGPRRRPDRRIGLSATRGESGRRRHAAVVHGHVFRVPRRMGARRHGLRLGPGRQVLPLGTSVRRVLASRIHGVARHAALRLSHLRGANVRPRAASSASGATPTRGYAG